MMQRIRKRTCYWMTRTRKYRHAWRVSTFITGVVMSSSAVQYGIVGSLMTFLTGDRLGKPLVIAAAIINMKEGLACFMAIIGSFIADAYLSRYFVVLMSVAFYFYGLFIFALLAKYKLVPSSLSLFCLALVLIAMGEGGLEHTLRKFGSDQFEEHIKDKYKAKPHSIAWWYMGSLIGSVAGMVLLTLISLRPSLGFLSSIFMLVAFLVLVLGTLFYYRDVPRGSPFTYMLHVVVAMAKKRHLDLPVDDSLIHGSIANMSDDRGMEKHDVDGNPDITYSRSDQNHSNNQGDIHPQQSGNSEENCGVEKGEEIKGGLLDDEQLRSCFDKTEAKEESKWRVCTQTEIEEIKGGLLDDEQLRSCFDKTEAKEESKWRVCTQTEIEETKLFLRLFPIWATFIMYGMVLSMGTTFFIEQASTLDAKLGSRFRIPVTFLLAVGGFSKLVITKACLPLLNKLTRLDHRIPPKVRIGAGLFLSALCCLTASLIENRRLKVKVQKELGMGIFWLIPQFLLLGGMEGLVGDGIDDLFISQVPETIWKCGPTFSESVEGMGSILSAIAMVLTDQMSKVGGRHGWFAKDIDESHLDRYYLMFAVLSLINLCLYALVAKAYILQGTENQHKRENNRGTVKRSVACVEMIAVIISGRD